MSDGSTTVAAMGGDCLDEPAVGGRRLSRISLRAWTSAVLAALLLTGAAIVWFNRPVTNAAVKSSRPVTAEVLEKQFGAKIEMVGLLAAGGLIELRFQVIDKDKAMALFGPVQQMPTLAVEGTSTVLQSAKGMKHGMTLLDGGEYFIFYTNARNVVHEGSNVSMVINGVRLEHLRVQK